MSSQHGGQSEMDISSVPQSVIWPKRYTPEELNGKTCFVMLHDGETLSDEYIGYSNLLGIVVKPLSKSEAVDFLIVDNKQTLEANVEVREIFNHAVKTNIPIYDLSYLRLSAINNKNKRDPVNCDLLYTDELDVQGRPLLTFDQRDFDEHVSADENDAFRQLGYIQLLKSPYVTFVTTLSNDQRAVLAGLIDDNPPRIRGTRQKISHVLNKFLEIAWECEGDTWTYIFDEGDFSKLFENYFGTVNPVAALRAAISVFMQNPQIFDG